MITQNDLINMKVRFNGSPSVSDILKDLIDKHNITPFIEGEKYYNCNGDIEKKRRFYWDNEIKKEDATKSNNIMKNNWHKLIVDQKTGYLLGKPVSINAEPNEYAEMLNDFLGEDFDDVLQELCKKSSNKGVEYLHPYINENGKFKYTIIPAEQIIPIYDSSLNKKLNEIIRYYNIIINGEKRIKVEWYTEKEITYYLQDENKNFKLDTLTAKVNPCSHFYYNGVGFGWGQVPFIPFKNNEEELSDLNYYKTLIDFYDKLTSDVADDLEEIQELITILKGYEGTSLRTFNDNLRFYKVIKVGEDGDVDKLNQEFPIDSIDSFLDRLEDNIFTFSQSVNPRPDKMGQAPSGIALKFMYHLLDLKANITARKFRKAIKEFLWFLTEYLKMIKKGNYDFKDVVIKFNKSILMNDPETVLMIQQSRGLLSDETLLEAHPFVEDPTREQQRIKAEEEGHIDLDSQLMNEIVEEEGIKETK